MEKYIIAKNASISYGDVGNMSPTERSYILQFLQEDAKKQIEYIKQIQGNK